MAGWTNRGKKLLLEHMFQGLTLPTNWYVCLFTSGSVPNADTNLVGDLIQIATGNGYSDGGYQLSSGSADFDFIEEDDTGDQGRIQLKDITWSASGGTIPSSGDGASYAALTDDNGTVANRNIYFFWSLTSPRQVSDGQDLTLQNCEAKLTES